MTLRELVGDLLDNIVCTYDAFENNLRVNKKLGKYFEESCWKFIDQHFFFRYLLKVAFVREISPNESSGFGRYRPEWVKEFDTDTST